jgi:CheY-like chemotaxis protein
LEKEKFNVVTVFDGDAVIPALTSGSVNLVILDIIMPKKTGFDVIDEIKANPATKDIPILLLSNLGQESDIARAKKKASMIIL